MDNEPLTDTDVDFDSDEDSFDCNGDGEISDSESFDNLAEFDSRWYGKRLRLGTFQMELVRYHTEETL